MELRAYPRGVDLYQQLEDDWGLGRMVCFTKSYFKMQQRDQSPTGAGRQWIGQRIQGEPFEPLLIQTEIKL